MLQALGPTSYGVWTAYSEDERNRRLGIKIAGRFGTQISADSNTNSVKISTASRKVATAPHGQAFEIRAGLMRPELKRREFRSGNREWLQAGFQYCVLPAEV
jgi:hypothetical protein